MRPDIPSAVPMVMLGALLSCAVFTARAEQPRQVQARPENPTWKHPAPEPPGFRMAPWPHAVATPQFELKGVDNQPRTLASFAGSVVVVYFGFLSCPDLCPATLLKLSRAMKQLGPTRRQVEVLFITLDPGHDSPKALKAYVQAFDPRIVALTGSTSAVDKAAAAFFVQHARVSSGGRETIDHSTGVFLVDARGRLQTVGSTQSSIEDFVHDLKLLASQ